MDKVTNDIVEQASAAAIEEAIKNNPVTPPVEDKKVDPPKKEESTEDWTELDAQNAKVLFSALKKGGEEATRIVDLLAKQSGYSKIETKAELKEAKTEIKHEILEALGDDYPDLATKLIPAIDKYLTRKLKEDTADLREAQSAITEKEFNKETERIFTKISDEYFDAKELPTDVDDKMAELIKKYPYDGENSQEEYLTDLFQMAAAKLGKLPQDSKTRKAVTAAKNNAPSKLDNSKGRPLPATEGGSTNSLNQKKMSLDESVRAAIVTENQRMEKG